MIELIEFFKIFLMVSGAVCLPSLLFVIWAYERHILRHKIKINSFPISNNVMLPTSLPSAKILREVDKSNYLDKSQLDNLKAVKLPKKGKNINAPKKS